MNFRTSLFRIPFAPDARRVSGVLFQRRMEGSGKFRWPRLDFADVRRSPREWLREDTAGHPPPVVRTSWRGCLSSLTACHARVNLLWADIWFTGWIFVVRTSSAIGTRSLSLWPVEILIALFRTTWISFIAEVFGSLSATRTGQYMPMPYLTFDPMMADLNAWLWWVLACGYMNIIRG